MFEGNFDELFFEMLKSENLNPEWVKNHSIKIGNKYISFIFRDDNDFKWKVCGVLVVWGFDKTYREVMFTRFTLDELIEKIKLIMLW